MSTGTGNGGQNGGLSKLISTLNLPNNWLVLAIVILSGGGNYLTTKDGNTEILKTSAREEEMKKVFSEVHEMHAKITEGFEKQKTMLSLLQALASPTPKQ